MPLVVEASFIFNFLSLNVDFFFLNSDLNSDSFSAAREKKVREKVSKEFFILNLTNRIGRKVSNVDKHSHVVT